MASSAAMADEIPDFDLYAELEVSERASGDTIQAAYRSLQRRNHPDRLGTDAGARSARLNIARDWLADPTRRARYDAHLAETRQTTRQAVPMASGRVEDRPMAGEGGGEASAEGDGDATADGSDPEPGPLRAITGGLRVDVAHLGRTWIAGLGFLGAVALVPGPVTETWLRVAVAAGAALVPLGLALGVVAPSGGGMAARLVRWTGMLVGWIALALLAVEGVGGLSGVVAGGPVPPGVGDATLPAVAVMAILSLFAVRRRLPAVLATVDDFLAMTPTEFETAVGGVLARHGYRLERTGGPGDLVADLAGTDPDGLPTVVQCKRYAPGHPVGSRDVQLLIAMGVRHHGAERLVLVTTSDFTDPALDLAEEHGVTLISGGDLEAMAG